MKQIQGFEDYFVNENGDVFSKKFHPFKNKNKELRKIKNRIDTKNYHYVSLRKEKKENIFRVHRLVALAFIPNLENKPYINHINGNRLDNRIENLEWCTPSENTRHGFFIGNMVAKNGVNSWNAKLDDEKVRLIRIDNRNHRLIALDYGVRRQSISLIKLRKSWKHVI